MSLRSQPFVQGSSKAHFPVYNKTPGEAPSYIYYQDEQPIGMQRIDIESLYLQEKISPSEKCDSILCKIIYSQAQFKAAEENAMWSPNWNIYK